MNANRIAWRWRWSRSHLAPLLILAGLSALLMGCNLGAALGIVGEAMFPPRVDPEYVPVKTAPMLVIVENRQNPGMTWPQSEQMAAAICAQLSANKVCPVVPQSKLEQLRDKDAQAFRKMSISALGKAVEAQQVLYVDLMVFDASSAPATPTTGQVEMRVHIVDVASGKTLWPTAPAGAKPMAYRTEMPKELEPDRMVVFGAQLTSGAARNVARLFYEWDPTAPEQK